MRKNAVTIGNFDGCHRGHQELIRATIGAAVAAGGETVALTFEPRPETFFRRRSGDPSGPAVELFTAAQKARALRELGIDRHEVLTFDADLASLTPRAFVQRYLVDRWAPAAVITGEDFCFGRGRQGNPAVLADLGQEFGFRVIPVPPRRVEDARISSTAVRAALQRGDVETAEVMLGRPYLLEGVVRRGRQLGRTLGFPTANLEVGAQAMPAQGVYAAWARPGADAGVTSIPDTVHQAVVNIGTRPTLDASGQMTIEAHLLATDCELYDRPLALYFVTKLRSEQQFPDTAALREQIARDCAAARLRLGRQRDRRQVRASGTDTDRDLLGDGVVSSDR